MGGSVLFAQRLERGAHLGGEQVWLFPGREVAASVQPVVVDEVAGIRTLGPAPRGLTSPGWPVPSPWSSMNAARSAGESASPYMVCGRVVIIWA
jgi:hypothetical protein